MPDHSRYIRMCVWLAVGPCLVSAVAVLTADFVVEGNDMIADTISAMAAGPNMWLAEIGIYAFALAFFAIALGGAAAHPGGWAWSAATMGFIAIGVIVFLIGFRDEYGDGDAATSENVHLQLVYALAGVLAVTAFLAAKGAKVVNQTMSKQLTALTIVWIVMAPVFVVLPTGYDGIYERALGAVAIAIVLTFCRVLNHTVKTTAKTTGEAT